MDKERAMSLILYGPLKTEEKPYRIFQNGDILWFINSGRSRWTAFRDDEAMQNVVLPNLGKLDSDVKLNGNFRKILAEREGKLF